MPTNKTKICPYCSEEILSTAIKCKHCHSMLTEYISSQSTSLITEISLAFSTKYEIIEKIGSGRMANVYKAKQKSLGRLVALKVFHQTLIHDTELFERFKREARIYATIKHPNIVDVYDFGFENGYHFISMEYISGTNLYQLIRQNGKLDPEQTTKIVLSIAEALDYAHSKGIIHRDIKSSNILISEEGKIYLTDFGIAHAAYESKITLPNEAIGTPEYMSPEQIEMEELDGRSDYYSLGVVMYECLTGHVPFASNNPLLVLDKIRTSNPPDIAKELHALDENIVLTIGRLLEKNREKRISSASDLKKMLKLPMNDIKLGLPVNHRSASDDQSVIHSQKSINEYYDPKFRDFLTMVNNFLYYDPEFRDLLIMGYNSLIDYMHCKDTHSIIIGLAKNNYSGSFYTKAISRFKRLYEVILLSKTYSHIIMGFLVFQTFFGDVNSILEVCSVEPYSPRGTKIIFSDSDNNLIAKLFDGPEGFVSIVLPGDKIYFGCPIGISCVTGAFYKVDPSDTIKVMEINTLKFHEEMKKIFLVE